MPSLRTPITTDQGKEPDERDARFANALTLLLPEVLGERGVYPNGSITLSVLSLASAGYYRCCGYPTTADMETWPPLITDRLPHLLPTIREIWRQCYTTT